MATRLWSVVIGANKPAELARFWSDALEWPVAEKDSFWSVARDDGLKPLLEFAPIPETKTSKNRFHFDLGCDGGEEQAELVARLSSLGARRVDVGQPADAWWTVMADPEGNEFCVLPRDPMFRGTGPIRAMGYEAFDPELLAQFWSAATGWVILGGNEQQTVLRSPNGTGPLLGFASGPGDVRPKTEKDRIHLDVAPLLPDDQQDEVARLESLGAKRIDIGQGDASWVVMADPEGNEFCVLTPR